MCRFSVVTSGQFGHVFGTWDVQAVLSPPRDERWPFRPWSLDGGLDESIHDIWCRRDSTQPWALQLMIADTRDDKWVYRRSPRVVCPVATMGGVTMDGIPYLAPEIQLLYKAKARRPKDEADFLHTLPMLDRKRRQWLRRALTLAHRHHAWLELLEAR